MGPAPPRFRGRRLAPRSVLLAPFLFVACRHIPPAPPRAPAPLPPAVAARYAGPGNPVAASLRLADGNGSPRWYEGELGAAGLPAVRFDLFRGSDGGSPAFVLVLPILAGDGALERFVARSLAKEGLTTAAIDRAGRVLTKDQTGEDVEAVIRATVSASRALLDWASESGLAPPGGIGVVGVSFGAAVATALLAVDPRVERAVLALGGGEVADLVRRSREGRVLRYLEARREAGAPPELVAREFGAAILSDPSHLAPHVDPRRVLFILATLDRVVPFENAERLWSALGRPERLDVPAGHYSTVLFWPYLKGAMVRHLVPRNGAARVPPRLADAWQR